MPDYRRIFRPGGTYFFSVVTEARQPFLCEPAARRILHEAIDRCRTERPFDFLATVLLPDHLHALWALPEGDSDYSGRWALIKAVFSRTWLESGGAERHRSMSRVKGRRRGIWQRRFWEHVVRDESDFERHLHYIHYNPVKHGLVSCPHGWPYSTFAKWMKLGVYSRDWSSSCDGRDAAAPLKMEQEHEWGE